MSSITGKVNSKGKIAGSVFPSSGVKNYEDLAGLPSINGVQLIGDKTTEDLKLEYVVHVTGDEESGFVADKTNAEISELSKRGFKVTLKVAGRSNIYELLSCSIENAVFQRYIPKTMRIDQVQIMLDNVYIGEIDVVPNPTVRGGIKADFVTENDTVPVKFNSEDGRAYASLNVAEKTEADTDYTSEVKIDPETRKLYGKKDYLPGRSVYYWNDNHGHTNDLGAIMAGSYCIGLVVGRTNVEGMTLPIFIIKGSTERGVVKFTGLDSSGNIYKGVYNLMNMGVSSLEKVTLGGS